MPTTAILVTEKDGISKTRLHFTTSPPTDEIIAQVDAARNVIVVQIFICDVGWLPLREWKRSIDDRSHEAYHRELRLKAKAADEFVKEYSTDPDWNPVEVIKPTEDGEQGK